MQTLDNQQKNTKSHGLGRGLDSLIPTGFDADEPVERATGLANVNLIDPNPDQPRREFDEEALAQLANSIREYGVIQPLLVTKKGDRFELVAGERRLRASKVAGLKEVPVIERTLKENERLEIAIIENVQRENLNPVELAYSYKHLIDQFSLTQDEVAKRVGKARSTIANTMRLISLPHDIKQALIECKITEGHARTLLGIDSVDKQMELFRQMLSGGMNVRQAESGAAGAKGRKSEAVDPNVKAAEKRMSEAVGTKVVIKRTGKGGKIVIDYYSFEDLERIFKKIVG